MRLSRPGEVLLALDGKEYTLDNEMTVIAGGDKPEALAGVMGGEESGCSANTKNVFLEAAYFDPIRTAITGRKLNLQSDARFRFERGVDPDFQIDATELASKMILEICGGEVSDLILAGKKPNQNRKYFLRETRVNDLGGVKVPKKDIEKILRSLGFRISKTSSGWNCNIPSWRHDVFGEADLVEEVLRIYGFDRIPAVSLERESNLPIGAVTLQQERRTLARRKAASRGLTEVVTFSFLSRTHAQLFGGAVLGLELINPISSDLDVMRPSILPNLISAVDRNVDRGLKDCSIFEVGPQYHGQDPGAQSTAVSGVRAGAINAKSWLQNNRDVDLFDVKADLEDLLLFLGVAEGSPRVERNAPEWYHPGRSGSMQLGPKKILGYFGEIHPKVLNVMGVDFPLVAFELLLDEIPFPKTGRGSQRPKLDLSPFQAVERDFAFIVDKDIDSSAVISAVRSSEKNLIKTIRVFDLFDGQSLGKNKKSIGITAELQPTRSTFSDAEIAALSEKIVVNVKKSTGGYLRS